MRLSMIYCSLTDYLVIKTEKKGNCIIEMFFFHKSFICTRLQTKIVYSLSLSLFSYRKLKSK